jgi:hypothetical protein
MTRRYAFGRIRYPDFPDGRYDGAIVYLKNSLIGDEWPDIRQYADAHADFPHETTADQFFDEDQFEAYRHLGFHIATQAVEALFGKGKVAAKTVAEMAEKLVPNKTPQVTTGA